MLLGRLHVSLNKGFAADFFATLTCPSRKSDVTVFLINHLRPFYQQYVAEAPVQVLNDRHAAVVAKVELRAHRGTDFSVYTDRMGTAHFYAIPAGNYTLVVSVAGNERYRVELSLLNAEGFRDEVIRLKLPPANKPQVVSVEELTVPNKAKEFYDAGVRAIHLHDWEKALSAFNNALTTYPRYAKAQNAIGVVLAMKTQFKEAEMAFRGAIELNSRMAEPHFNLGKLLLDTHRTSEARTELQRSVELGSENPSAIGLLIDTMILTHDEDSALALVRSLHSRHMPHAARLHLEIGSALEEHSRMELASEQYIMVLNDSPSESERGDAEFRIARFNDH